MYLSIGTESCPYSSRPPCPHNYSSWVTLKFYILKRWHCIHVLPQHSTPIPEAVSWRGQWPFYTVDLLGDLCGDELILLRVTEGKEFWSGSCWLYSATLHQMICASISLSRCICFHHHHGFLMWNKNPSYRVCKGRWVALYETTDSCLHTECMYVMYTCLSYVSLISLAWCFTHLCHF